MVVDRKDWKLATWPNLILDTLLRRLVQSPCGKINVMREGVLVHDVLQLHCQQI